MVKLIIKLQTVQFAHFDCKKFVVMITFSCNVCFCFILEFNFSLKSYNIWKGLVSSTVPQVNFCDQ